MKNKYVIPEITPRTHKAIEEKRLRNSQSNNNNEKSVNDQLQLLQEDSENNKKEIDPWEDPKYQTIVKSIIIFIIIK